MMRKLQAMFRRLLFLTLIVAAVTGCEPEEDPKATTIERPKISIPKLSEPPPPRKSGKLVLLAEGENVLRLGDTMDMVEKIFPTPQGAVPFKGLPPGFGDGYEARGYETSRESFGGIFHDNGLILAMERRENVDPEIVGETVDRYERQFGPAKDKVTSKKIQYWFWEEADRRIMVCSTPDERYPTTCDLNISFGDVVMMDAFRMGVTHANNDRQAIEGIKPTPAR